jgi:protein O-GlcNAc transferase
MAGLRSGEQIEKTGVMEKQKLRMIHNMARSGSTLMCKCLGCMEGVVLLSELHPRAWSLFNPLKQAEEWFGLLTPNEIAELQKQGGVNYTSAIALIEQRCRERGDTLVLRDWAHLDYTGFPFITTPGYRPLLYTELAESFDIIRISTTRDPVTQWQSLIQLAVMHEPLQSGAFSLDQFLAGYRKYAELCVETGFVRYEDFLRKPELAMRKLCEHLQIKFDPGFIKKWPDYKTITGDIVNPRSSNKIKIPAKRPVEPGLRKQFLANADYHRACALLGYNPLAK